MYVVSQAITVKVSHQNWCKVSQQKPRGVDSHMKQTGMLVENFEFNP